MKIVIIVVTTLSIVLAAESTKNNSTRRQTRATHDEFRRADILRLFDDSRPGILVLRLPRGPNPVYKVQYIRRGGVKLVKAIQAEFQYSHLTTDRTSFGNNWDSRMREQNACGNRYGRRECQQDERGHLVASAFSGPITWYNLVPQTPAVNANRGLPGWQRAQAEQWYNLEVLARNHLQQFRDRGYVRWNVAVNFDDSGRNSNRAKGFRVYVTFHRLDSSGRAQTVGTWDSYYDNTPNSSSRGK